MGNPCKYGHDVDKNKRGNCMECLRLRYAKYREESRDKYLADQARYLKSPKGVKKRSIENAKRYAKDAAAAGIHPDVRRKIEDMEIMKDIDY